MKYYPAFKRKEILTYATTGMDLQDIMLSEISQLQSTSTVWLHINETYNFDYLKWQKVELRLPEPEERKLEVIA